MLKLLMYYTVEWINDIDTNDIDANDIDDNE